MHLDPHQRANAIAVCRSHESRWRTKRQPPLGLRLKTSAWSGPFLPCLTVWPQGVIAPWVERIFGRASSSTWTAERDPPGTPHLFQWIPNDLRPAGTLAPGHRKLRAFARLGTLRFPADNEHGSHLLVGHCLGKALTLWRLAAIERMNRSRGVDAAALGGRRIGRGSGALGEPGRCVGFGPRIGATVPGARASARPNPTDLGDRIVRRTTARHPSRRKPSLHRDRSRSALSSSGMRSTDKRAITGLLVG